MDGELNGRMEWMRDPNVENEMWARGLGEVVWEPEGEMGPIPHLPTDVIAVVAELLAGDNDLQTIARLSAASREVHESTLPVLYESVKFDTERSFARSVGLVSPRGWRYTKFLFVTDITLPLVHMHLRYASQLTSTDLLTLFPRLVLLGVSQLVSHEKIINHDAPLHLTLYRPLTLPALLRASLRKGSSSSGGITLFGTYYLDKTPQPGTRPRFKPTSFRDIIGLTFRPGAHLVTDAARTTRGWHATWVGNRFSLDVPDDIVVPGVSETLATVVDHLALYASSSAVKSKNNDIFLDLKCTSGVFERFIEFFNTRQPLFLNLEATLTDPITRPTILRHLTALANAYASHWTHPYRPHQLFIQIYARAPVLPSQWLEPDEFLLPPTADHYAAWHAEAMFGWEPNTDFDDEHPAPPVDAAGNAGQPGGGGRAIPAGFTITLSQALMLDDFHEHGEQVYSRAYQLAPVPVAGPAPAAEPRRMPAGMVEALLRALPAPGRVGEEQLRAQLRARLEARAAEPPAPLAAVRPPSPEIQAQLEQHDPQLLRELAGIDPRLIAQLAMGDGEPVPEAVLRIARQRMAREQPAQDGDAAGEPAGDERQAENEAQDAPPGAE